MNKSWSELYVHLHGYVSLSASNKVKKKIDKLRAKFAYDNKNFSSLPTVSNLHNSGGRNGFPKIVSANSGGKKTKYFTNDNYMNLERGLCAALSSNMSDNKLDKSRHTSSGLTSVDFPDSIYSSDGIMSKNSCTSSLSVDGPLDSEYTYVNVPVVSDNDGSSDYLFEELSEKSIDGSLYSQVSSTLPPQTIPKIVITKHSEIPSYCDHITMPARKGCVNLHLSGCDCANDANDMEDENVSILSIQLILKQSHRFIPLKWLALSSGDKVLCPENLHIENGTATLVETDNGPALLF